MWSVGFDLLINQIRILLCVDLDFIISFCLPMCGKDNDGLGLDFRGNILAYALQSFVDCMIDIVHDTRLPPCVSIDTCTQVQGQSTPPWEMLV